MKTGRLGKKPVKPAHFNSVLVGQTTNFTPLCRRNPLDVGMRFGAAAERFVEREGSQFYPVVTGRRDTFKLFFQGLITENFVTKCDFHNRFLLLVLCPARRIRGIITDYSSCALLSDTLS